jgi:hypothetical protein
MWVLAPQDTHLIRRAMSSSSREARLRTRNESIETKAKRIVIMPQRYGGGTNL